MILLDLKTLIMRLLALFLLLFDSSLCSEKNCLMLENHIKKWSLENG
jgi:hypothetical protein